MIAKLGSYPLVINPTICNIHLGNVLVDGGSGLNILFADTLTERAGDPDEEACDGGNQGKAVGDEEGVARPRRLIKDSDH